MQGFAYFPSIVYRDEKPDWVVNVAQAIEPHLVEAEKLGHGLCQTFDVSKQTSLKPLSEYLLHNAIEILKDQGYATQKYDFQLNVWGQKLKKGQGTAPHIHKNSQIGGWFFIEAPKNGSYPIFYDSRVGKSMVELDFETSSEVTNATNSIHFNNIVPGTVLFSNSWLTHQLTQNNSEESVKAIHFIISHKNKEV